METPHKNKSPRRVSHSDEKRIIYKVIQFCDEEKEKGLVIPLQRATARAAKAVGKSECTIKNIRRDFKNANKIGAKVITPRKIRAPRKRISFDEFDKCVVRRKFLEFYEQKKEIPTLRKLFVYVKRELHFQGERETFRKIVKDLGFRFKKCKDKRQILTEREDIVARRAQYLRALRANEMGPKKPLVYTDETWIHTHYTLKKCWQHDDFPGVLVNSSTGQRAIVVHAGDAMGFVEGAELIYDSRSKSQDFHDDMNSTNYRRWLEEKLIPNLPAGSIVVIDNAPYHTVQENKSPTTSSRKSDIIDWLTRNNIQFDSGLTRNELLRIVKQSKPKPIYTVDRILRERGFQVLRLPPYSCDLNPIELIWNLLKQKIAAHNVSSVPLSTLKEMTRNDIREITQEDWVKACNKVKKIEDDYWRRDALMEEAIDNLIINVGFDSSDDEISEADDKLNDEPEEREGSCTDTADEELEELNNISTDTADEEPDDRLG